MVPKLKYIVTLYGGITLRYLVSLVTRSWDDVRSTIEASPSQRLDINSRSKPLFELGVWLTLCVPLVAISITSRKNRPRVRNGAMALLEQRLRATPIINVAPNYWGRPHIVRQDLYPYRRTGLGLMCLSMSKDPPWPESAAMVPRLAYLATSSFARFGAAVRFRGPARASFGDLPASRTPRNNNTSTNNGK
jgi:hypothetical protein